MGFGGEWLVTQRRDSSNVKRDPVCDKGNSPYQPWAVAGLEGEKPLERTDSKA